jgi:hypothetical protein
MAGWHALILEIRAIKNYQDSLIHLSEKSGFGVFGKIT